MNLAVILNYLHRQAPVSRTQLARVTGLNRATVTNLTRELISRGLVIESETSTQPPSVGHPAIDLVINPDAGRIIAAEITATRVTAALTDLRAEIMWRCDEAVLPGASMEQTLGLALEMLQDAYQAALDCALPIFGIGLGLQGMVDFFNDILLYTPEHGWMELPLGEMIGDHFPLPLFTGNIVHMVAQGENYYGDTQKTNNAIYVSLDSNIDGSIFFNDTILPGAEGLAGSFGHMSLDPLGEPCTCGNCGCWNLFASQSALMRRIEQRIGRGEKTLMNSVSGSGELDIHAVVEAAQRFDRVALEALHETASWIGIGLANLINLMNPENVVLGGSMIAAEEFLLPVIRQEIDRYALKCCSRCNISAANVREEPGLVGITATVIWNVLNRADVALPAIRGGV